MSGQGEIFAYVIIGFFFGVFLFFKGFLNLKLKRTIENMPTSRCRSISMGPVEVAGKAMAPSKLLFVGPLTDKECVYFTSRVEEYVKRGKSGYWRTLKYEEGIDPFLVQDNSGRVLVNPKGAEMRLEPTLRLALRSQAPTPVIKKYLEENKISYVGIFGMRKNLRLTEYTILPGEEIYVLGTAGENPNCQTQLKNEDGIIIGRSESFPFLISSSSEKSLLAKLKRTTLLYIYGGPALSIACLIIIFLYLGSIW